MTAVLYLNNQITQAVSDIQMGIGGGGLIIKDGAEYTGTAHKITPNSKDPRTVIATVKNSKEVLLITIDGRGEYKGMTHKDLVSFLKSYNVKDAMYFDGGGSTTMVARNEGETKVTVQNYPSDGNQRKVINGVGVFTTSQPGPAYKLYLSTAFNRTFLGESMSLNLRAVDENENPVSIDKSKVTYSVSGVTGNFEGSKFIPTSIGKALIVASYEGIDVGYEIQVSTPVGIRVEPSNLQVSENSTKIVKVYGIDTDGYSMPLSEGAIKWTSSNNTVGATNNTVVTKGKTTALLRAEYKGVKANLGVIVGNITNAIESFETNKASWGGDTSTVKGNVIICNDEKYKYHGNKSVKMTYTFEKSQDKQVAYTLFNTPIAIPGDAMSVNMWLYGKKQGDVAKIEVVDSNNKKFYLKLTDSIDFNGWKYVSATLPEEMVLPAKVTKFYTYANSVNEKKTTAIYLDHVSITRGFRGKSGLNTRDDFRFDPWYKKTLQGPKDGQYMINVVGSTKVSSMSLNKEAVQKIGNQLSNQTSLVVMAAKNNMSLPLNTKSISYKNTYEITDYANTV
ncbi:phosphodiester glycosidase family protein [Cellulosilyticum ruminicola]|uniref:phosphodiester glycosidase family protein n=1 Tax=Cellulosilyticum ruminicola TaxID=425254 RepID=UPI00278BD5DB|nr:phosphodiester glycosidase family protein [Cellulosilyticum ruminicola]